MDRSRFGFVPNPASAALLLHICVAAPHSAQEGTANTILSTYNYVFYLYINTHIFT